MVTSRPGTQCNMRVNWWDARPGEEGFPVEGDFLRTAAGSCYLIDEWRPSRPGSESLGTFLCTRLERDAVAFGDPGVFEWAFWSAT
jgi:hypothetical protein